MRVLVLLLLAAGAQALAIGNRFPKAATASRISNLGQRAADLIRIQPNTRLGVSVPNEASDVDKVDTTPAASPSSSTLKQTLKVGGAFALWYILNIGYNIYNKKVLNALPLPYTMAAVQLAAGLLIFVPLWVSGIRKAPKLSRENLKNLFPLASLHTGAHLTAVLSLGAGAVSFTHIVKAAEPAFSALFAAVLMGQVFAAPVYLTLIPVIAGVAVASMKELAFSWVSFGNAMGSNTFSALRGIYAKKNMGNPQGENMNSANLYAVLTCFGIALLTPIALILEGGKMGAAWTAAVAAYGSQQLLLWHALLSGLYYYSYNEVAFLALSQVHPITHAVGNTIKRVVVIIASVIVFGTTMTPTAIAGSSVAILGTLMYALAKNYYQKKKD
uniref:Sugar phosphate transporter domain-containing protein n=1 Tax=Pinguiococcus pyrenoidosus TaxID=172671 RepID=A0A7R9YBK2_9STRA|mmetsp:Transcript_17227/g.65733  ORF Transcript_17227/g.65733 Transcript_17227/m.65733 type:complete len:386 (+) Transcript_17227:81-1238(+)